jgi:hypothetical protein
MKQNRIQPGFVRFYLIRQAIHQNIEKLAACKLLPSGQNRSLLLSGSGFQSLVQRSIQPVERFVKAGSESWTLGFCRRRMGPRFIASTDLTAMAARSQQLGIILSLLLVGRVFTSEFL